MKVCITCAGLPPFYGGAERRAYRFAEHLQAVSGIEAVLIGIHRFPPDQSHSDFPAHVYDVRLHFENTGGFRSFRQVVQWVLHIGEMTLRLAFLLVRLRKKFDLLHCINPYGWFSLIPVPLAKLMGKKTIVEMTLRGVDDPLALSRQSKAKQQTGRRKPLRYRLFLMADAYVSKSAGLSDAYRRAGLDESILFEIPSAVDVDRFCPVSQDVKSEKRRQFALPPEKILITFVGGIEERKGPDRLLRAFHRLLSQQQNIHLLLIAGWYDKPYAANLRDYLAENQLQENVTLVGPLENVEEYLQMSDIFCLPTRSEGLSMAILEAMSVGLAVLATDIPEIAGVQIEHGETGLLFPVDDIDELASCLLRLVKNSTLRARIGANARRRVLDEFSPPVVDEKYEHLYRFCLDQTQMKGGIHG